MLVTVIRRLDTPRISLKPLCIQIRRSRSFYSIASARNVSDSVNGSVGNSPSSNRVICLVTDPLLLAFILGRRKQATTFVLGNEISEIAIPGTIIPHVQESK